MEGVAGRQCGGGGKDGEAPGCKHGPLTCIFGRRSTSVRGAGGVDAGALVVPTFSSKTAASL